MKNTLLLIGIVSLSSCCEKTLTTYDLNELQKSIVSYKLNDVVKFETSEGETLITKVHEVKDSYMTNENGCDEFHFGEKRAILTNEKNNYYFSVEKKSKNVLSIGVIIGNLDYSNSNYSGMYYYNQDNTFEYTTINVDGLTFENSIKLTGDPDTNIYTIISKTNGIEYMHLGNNKWIKRIN